jgi:molybdopterin converting factor small subunit
VKVIITTEGGTTTFENDSVENVAALISAAGPLLNIGSGVNLAVNGNPATPETPLADGDEVSTTKAAGRKG